MYVNVQIFKKGVAKGVMFLLLWSIGLDRGGYQHMKFAVFSVSEWAL